MRYLVTGATGFAGAYLVESLLNEGHSVFGLVRPNKRLQAEEFRFRPVYGDILDPESMLAAVSEAKPDLIFHLAGMADVGRSWKIPAETISVNVNGTIHLLDAALSAGCKRVVAVTSADIYGPQPPEAMPLTETSRPRAYHPYGVSKIAASEMLHLYAKRYPELEIIEARPFNHIGPGQKLGFVVPDFASQIASIKLGKAPNRIRVGNLSAERDFLDVRDVVRAYIQLGRTGIPGETYLICSGNPISIQTVLDRLIAIAQVEVDIQTAANRLRPSDTPILFGSTDKLNQDTGWIPQIALDDTLSAVLDEWMGLV